jgi:hypothetical protein
MQILMQTFDIKQSFCQVVENVQTANLRQIFGHILPRDWPIFDKKVNELGQKTANIWQKQLLSLV